MLELYHAGLTTCSKKSRLCLKEKGLPYKSHYVRLDRFEHHTPEYLKINPNGIVPTLVHDGNVVIESGVINEYVDEVFPETPLRPADPLGRARMRVFCKMADEYALPATRVPTWTRTKAAQLKAMDEREFDRIVKETPLVDHQLKLQALKGEGFSKKDFDEAYGRMDYVFNRTETALADGPYLAGAHYTLADIAILPYVFAFNQVRPELMQSHPRTRQWYERVMARPAVQATYNPSEEAPAPGPAR
ncbi:MAG TPA: glutathione S-transferase family protein [Stellaceae bacterium]|nr:glutathione S-transferase family protein [Stellaceae bacterium]